MAKFNSIPSRYWGVNSCVQTRLIHSPQPGGLSDGSRGLRSAERDDTPGSKSPRVRPWSGRLEFGHVMASSTRPPKAVGPQSPGGRFENSPPFQGWDCRREASSPEGTADFLPEKWEFEQTHEIRWIQPSLRDLRDGGVQPGSELPGYSRISLRERFLRSQFPRIGPLNRGRDALPRVQADRQVGPTTSLERGNACPIVQSPFSLLGKWENAVADSQFGAAAFPPPPDSCAYE